MIAGNQRDAPNATAPTSRIAAFRFQEMGRAVARIFRSACAPEAKTARRLCGSSDCLPLGRSRVLYGRICTLRPRKRRPALAGALLPHKNDPDRTNAALARP